MTRSALRAGSSTGLGEAEIAPAGRLSVSIGIAQGPEHAMNPRELVACAEIAMMTAKARGKDQAVLFEEEAGERPTPGRRRPRRPLDRAPEDAAEPRRQAQPPERRPRDRRRDRQRAADARRLPQLPPVRRRRREPRPGGLARRPRPLRGGERRSAHLHDRRRASPAGWRRPASRSCWPTPSTASSQSRSREPRTWTSR